MNDGEIAALSVGVLLVIVGFWYWKQKENTFDLNGYTYRVKNDAYGVPRIYPVASSSEEKDKAYNTLDENRGKKITFKGRVHSIEYYRLDDYYYLNEGEKQQWQDTLPPSSLKSKHSLHW